MRFLHRGKSKNKEGIKEHSDTISPNIPQYQFKNADVILPMRSKIEDLPDTPQYRELYNRFTDSYYNRNGEIELTNAELLLIRKQLGNDDGSMSAYGHWARVELDNILNKLGLNWQEGITAPTINNGNPHLLTMLEERERKSHYMPVITNYPNIPTNVKYDYQIPSSPYIYGFISQKTLTNIKGIIAFRCWEYERGYLKSTSRHTIWKEIMFSDELPSHDNNSGIYATKLCPYTVMRKTWKYVDPLCGLIELRGKIIEHRDGILRAEFARIINIFLIPAWVSQDTLISQLIREVNYNYPNIPLSVLLPEQLANIITRAVA